MGRTLPVGAMLMSIDMRDELNRVVSHRIPFLPVWGCFDRIVSARTAAEEMELTGREVVWVPGGHSWMLPRPRGQLDVLRHLEPGRTFLDEVHLRRERLLGSDGMTPGLRALR